MLTAVTHTCNTPVPCSSLGVCVSYWAWAEQKARGHTSADAHSFFPILCSRESPVSIADVEEKLTQRTIDVKIELLQEVQLRRAVF